jgi:hypothetical protein
MFESSVDKAQAWADLISVLNEAKAANEGAEKTRDEATIRDVGLAQAQRALRAAIRLFNTDPAIRAGGLVRAYAPLHSSLHDVRRGAHPPFLFEQTPKTAAGGRPTELIHDYVRAHLAFALDLLLAPVGGMSRKTALAWLVGEAKKLKVAAEDGSPIEVRQFERWRHEIKQGTAPKVSRDHFRELNKSYRENIQRISRLPRFARAADAQERVRFILKNLSNLAPRDAPAKKRHQS